MKLVVSRPCLERQPCHHTIHFLAWEGRLSIQGQSQSNADTTAVVGAYLDPPKDRQANELHAKCVSSPMTQMIKNSQAAYTRAYLIEDFRVPSSWRLESREELSPTLHFFQPEGTSRTGGQA